MRMRMFVYVQLLVMVLYILRPIMPFIDYAINKDFIISNLCINRDKPHDCCEGRCYLEKQIKNNAESEPTKQNSTQKRVQNEEINEFIFTPISIVKVYEADVYYWIIKEKITPSRFTASIFIPPR